MNKDEIAGLVGRIESRQHDAPMPTEHLLDEAKDALTTLSAENEALRHDVQRQMTIAIEHVNESATLSARVETLEADNGKLRRCLLPVQMVLAQAECVDDPLPDSAVVLSFMGSGASDQVTAGEVRQALGGDNG